jgi:hypothetical protein
LEQVFVSFFFFFLPYSRSICKRQFWWEDTKTCRLKLNKGNISAIWQQQCVTTKTSQTTKKKAPAAAKNVIVKINNNQFLPRFLCASSTVMG